MIPLTQLAIERSPVKIKKNKNKEANKQKQISRAYIRLTSFKIPGWGQENYAPRFYKAQPGRVITHCLKDSLEPLKQTADL